MSFNNFTFKHLSPGDRAIYQRELLLVDPPEVQ